MQMQLNDWVHHSICLCIRSKSSQLWYTSLSFVEKGSGGLKWDQLGSIGVKRVQGGQDGQGLSETLIEKLNKKLNGRLDDRL